MADQLLIEGECGYSMGRLQGLYAISGEDGMPVAYAKGIQLARLIAAAPDLLEALEHIVKEWDGEPEDMWDAKDAIRKARNTAGG